MKSIYLTIDLDFWSDSQVDIDFVERAINCVPRERMAAAVFHDSILPHLERFNEECTHLINLDHHSDIGGDIPCTEPEYDGCLIGYRKLALHSGSWGDYAAFKVSDEFLWLYPTPECPKKYRCDAFTLDHRFSRAGQGSGIAWKRLRHRLAKPPRYGIALSKARALSIVLSPDYCGDDAIDIFITLVRRYDLELLDILPENLEKLRKSSGIIWKSG